MLAPILSSIRVLTISISGLTAADCRLIAAGVLGLAAENGTVAAPLAAIAAEVEQPADQVLAVLRALAAAGLVALQVPPLTGADGAEAWVVLWWAGFAGAGVTVNIYSGGADGQAETGGASHTCAGAGARVMDGVGLFVCSSTENDLGDLDNIKTNKQTTRARSRACEGDAAGETGRIVALLTDPAVTAGLLCRSTYAPVGCFPADKAREIAAAVLKNGGSFDQVLGNICQWRREVESGRVWSPLPALRARLERGFDGSITAADRALPWFAVHAPAFGWECLTENIYSAGDGDDGDLVEVAAGGTENIYSAPAETAPVSAVDLGYWLPLITGADRSQCDLAGAIVERDDTGDGWIVRLDHRSRPLLSWLRARGNKQVGRAIAAALGLGAQPVPVRFVDGCSIGD